jgi:hypothetical protein
LRDEPVGAAVSADWILGVDFGTTTTVAATRDVARDRADVLRFGDAYRMSSAVLLEPDGSLSAGPHVEQERVLAPERVERCPKRQVGQGSVFVGGQWHRDVELVAAVLRTVYAEALRIHDGNPPIAVRLTRPVRWEGARRDALLEAAALAGMSNVELVPEPIAAAVALVVAGRADYAEVATGQIVAVFDFGGGTLDVALLRRTDTGFELAGPPGGDEHLGGEDINDALVQFLAGRLPDEDRRNLFDPDSAPNPDAWARAAAQFENQVRLAKESLVDRPLVRLPMLSPPLSTAFAELSADDLATTVRPIVRTAADRLDSTIRQAGFEPSDVAVIYLAGGSSRLNMVRRVLGQRFGLPMSVYGDPKGLVALGAAEMAFDPASAGHAGDPPPAPPEPPRAPALVEPPTVVEPPGHAEPPALDASPWSAAARPDRWAASSVLSPGATAQAADPGPTAAAWEAGSARDAPAVPAGSAGYGPLMLPTVEQSLASQHHPGWVWDPSYVDPSLAGAAPQPLRMERWLVADGQQVDIDQPLAIASYGSARQHQEMVRSICSGVVARRAVSIGSEFGAYDAVVAIASVSVMRTFHGMPPATSGIELVVPPLTFANPAESAAKRMRRLLKVNIRGVRLPRLLAWDARYGFVLSPGMHELRTAFSDSMFGGGLARIELPVQPSAWTTVAFVPPPSGTGPGQLYVVA